MKSKSCETRHSWMVKGTTNLWINPLWCARIAASLQEWRMTRTTSTLKVDPSSDKTLITTHFLKTKKNEGHTEIQYLYQNSRDGTSIRMPPRGLYRSATNLTDWLSWKGRQTWHIHGCFFHQDTRHPTSSDLRHSTSSDLPQVVNSHTRSAEIRDLECQ